MVGMAADQGFAPAQASLGLMYYDGQGVPKDYVLAYMWINLAPSNSTEEDVREQSGKMRDKISLDNGSQLLNGKGVSA